MLAVGALSCIIPVITWAANEGIGAAGRAVRGSVSPLPLISACLPLQIHAVLFQPCLRKPIRNFNAICAYYLDLCWWYSFLQQACHKLMKLSPLWAQLFEDQSDHFNCPCMFTSWNSCCCISARSHVCWLWTNSQNAIESINRRLLISGCRFLCTAAQVHVSLSVFVIRTLKRQLTVPGLITHGVIWSVSWYILVSQKGWLLSVGSVIPLSTGGGFTNWWIAFLSFFFCIQFWSTLSFTQNGYCCKSSLILCLLCGET